MDKQVRQRDINAIANQTANTRSVIALPCWIDGQWNFRRPTRQRTSRKQNGVSERLISATTFVEHSREHRHVEIGVIVNPHFSFGFVSPMKSANVLGDRSSPGNR